MPFQLAQYRAYAYQQDRGAVDLREAAVQLRPQVRDRVPVGVRRLLAQHHQQVQSETPGVAVPRGMLPYR